MTQTTLMSIPGQIDPVPVARDITPREDGRVDLIGLPKDRIRELFDEAGLDAKQAKLRAKQVFHWLYHRGVTDFEYEYQLTGMNRQLNDHIETVFLMADVELQPIASRLVKEIAFYGGPIEKFVTPAVRSDVEARVQKIGPRGG